MWPACADVQQRMTAYHSGTVWGHAAEHKRCEKISKEDWVLHKLAGMTVHLNLMAPPVFIEKSTVGHNKPDSQLDLVRSLQCGSKHGDAILHSSGGTWNRMWNRADIFLAHFPCKSLPRAQANSHMGQQKKGKVDKQVTGM